MGRVKEWMIEEERIKFERAEAAYYYFALPEAQAKALEGIHEILQPHLQLVEQNGALKEQVSSLQTGFREATSPASRWRERTYGFAFGIAASVAASLLWAKLIKQWPGFG